MPVDAWALGVVMHVLLAGLFPFTNTNATAEGLVAPLPESVPAEAHSLLHGLLTVDVEARTSAVEASRDPWLAAIDPGDVCTGGKDATGSTVIASGSPAAWLRARVSGDLPTNAASAHLEVLEELASLGFNKQEVESAVKAGAKNDLSTSYFLVCRRRARLAEEREIAVQTLPQVARAALAPSLVDDHRVHE